MGVWQSVNFAICILMIRHSLSRYVNKHSLWARNRGLKDNFRAYFPSRRSIFWPIVKSVHLRLFKNHIRNWQISCFIFSCKPEFIQSKWVVWCLTSMGRLKSFFESHRNAVTRTQVQGIFVLNLDVWAVLKPQIQPHNLCNQCVKPRKAQVRSIGSNAYQLAFLTFALFSIKRI